MLNTMFDQYHPETITGEILTTAPGELTRLKKSIEDFFNDYESEGCFDNEDNILFLADAVEILSETYKLMNTNN